MKMGGGLHQWWRGWVVCATVVEGVPGVCRPCRGWALQGMGGVCTRGWVVYAPVVEGVVYAPVVEGGGVCTSGGGGGWCVFLND